MEPRTRFQIAQTYAVYYGTKHETELMRHALAIIEPKGHTEEATQLMRDSETIVLAYVSVMEVARDHEDFKYLDSEDFLELNGGYLRNEPFDTYVINLQSRKWRSLLHYSIGKLLLFSGYDGVFLDTIGDVEMNCIPFDRRSALCVAAAEIVSTLREAFPSKVFVQNNGLEGLVDATAPYLDGVCWENPPIFQEDSQGWIDHISKKLSKLYFKSSIRTLLLTDDLKTESSSKMEMLKRRIPGSLLYMAPKNYLEICR